MNHHQAATARHRRYDGCRVDTTFAARRFACTTTWVAELGARQELPSSCIVPGTSNVKFSVIVAARIPRAQKCSDSEHGSCAIQYSQSVMDCGHAGSMMKKNPKKLTQSGYQHCESGPPPNLFSTNSVSHSNALVLIHLTFKSFFTTHSLN